MATSTATTSLAEDQGSAASVPADGGAVKAAQRSSVGMRYAVAPLFNASRNGETDSSAPATLLSGEEK